jgi:hypothetical protein
LLNLTIKGEIDELWQFVFRVYKKDISQKIVGILFSGALEVVFIAIGVEYIGRVELLAANKPKFKCLLGGEWNKFLWSLMRLLLVKLLPGAHAPGHQQSWE